MIQTKIHFENEIRELNESIYAKVEVLKNYIKTQDLEKKMIEYQEKSKDINLWNNPSDARKILSELKYIENFLENYNSYKNQYDNASEIFELYKNEESMLEEVYDSIKELYSGVNSMYLSTLFSGVHDDSECFIAVTAGSGGLEAQDWANILFGMYVGYAKNSKDYKAEIVDYTESEGGLKSGTIKVSGTPKSFPYGMLKGENGVHRLVRPSPFNANNNRHTSFASVLITPAIDDDIDITILESDLRIDTYRSSGAGGQHVNKTDSAVRLTHIPTGVVVQCQNDRSQHRNKAEAMKILRSRLYILEEEKRKTSSAEKINITWGNQIRSYVLDDSRIKDLRTGYESSQTSKVLEGDLQAFLEAYIRYNINK